MIRRAVPKMKDRVLQDASGYFEAFNASKDPMAWGDLNRDFHWTRYSASELPCYLGIIDNAMNRIERYLRAQLVMSGENVRASALTRDHILGAKASLRLHMTKSGQASAS